MRASVSGCAKIRGCSKECVMRSTKRSVVALVAIKNACLSGAMRAYSAPVSLATRPRGEHDHVRLLAAYRRESQLAHGVRYEPERFSAMVLEGWHGSSPGISAKPRQPFLGQDVFADGFLVQRQGGAIGAIGVAVMPE